MFLHVSVILFTGGASENPPRPGRHPPWQGEPPLAGRPPRQGEPPPDQADSPGRETPPQTRQTPPAGRTPPPREEDCSIRSMSGRYASYWNAFLSNLNCVGCQRHFHEQNGSRTYSERKFTRSKCTGEEKSTLASKSRPDVTSCPTQGISELLHNLNFGPLNMIHSFSFCQVRTLWYIFFFPHSKYFLPFFIKMFLPLCHHSAHSTIEHLTIRVEFL